MTTTMVNPFAGAKLSVESKSGAVIPDAGGYDVFAVMDDGDVLCRACVLDPTNPVHDERSTFGSNRWTGSDGWGVIAFDHTGNLDEPEHCAHCAKEIG